MTPLRTPPLPTATASASSGLTAATRTAALQLLAEHPFDIIVVGGGVTGAGVALDAAARGLRTALVERVDLAAGTSRWSSKLVHGGLRYLAKGDIALAREAAIERHHLLTTIAPHLVEPLATVVPLDAATGPAAGLVTEAGIRFADALRLACRTPERLLPRPRRLSVRDTLVHAPGLRPEGLRGGILYFDGQVVDDARLVTALARTAAAYGARIVTHCAASQLTADSLTLTDLRTGESFTARGSVVNATGVWAGDHEPTLTMTPSRGSHLVVRAASLRWPRAMVTAPVPGHFGRFVFAIPQADDLVLIGLTDEPAPGVDGIAPDVPAEDERFLLDVVNRALRTPLTADDVVGRFAGLRPLLHRTTEAQGDAPGEGAGAGTADLSRHHLLLNEPGRPVTIAGGKLTTYRRMAEDTVDVIARRMGQHIPCATRRLPLVGAASRTQLDQIAADPRLVRRYGVEAPRVAALAQRHPHLAAPVVSGRPTIGAELLWGVLAEGALDPADLVERRTRLTLIDADREQAYAVATEILALAGELTTAGITG